jgi:hypothetical protein
VTVTYSRDIAIGGKVHRVMMTVDVDKLAATVGPKAAGNKRGKSRALKGAVRVAVTAME